MMFFSNWVDSILKAQGHRYLKRIPYMSGGKRRYRYIYKVTHTHRGRQAFDEAHLVEGTAFMLHPEKGAEFHGHITNVSGDQVTYRIDDGARKGEEITVSKSELLAQLNDVHDIERGVSAERDKVRSQIEQARKTGSEKQVRRLEERLARLGGAEKRAEPEPEKKRATSEDVVRALNLNEEDADDARVLKGLERAFLSFDSEQIEQAKTALIEELTRRAIKMRPTFDAEQYTADVKQLKQDRRWSKYYMLNVLNKREKRQLQAYNRAQDKTAGYFREANREKARVEEEKLRKRWERTKARREAYEFAHYDAPARALSEARDKAREPERLK